MKNYDEYIELLKALIQMPSFSGEENDTAGLIEGLLIQKGIATRRVHHNIIARNRSFSADKKTIVLNSHHDTVKVNKGWKHDPFGAFEADGKIFGLGSNDAGAALVALIATFCHYYDKNTDFNLVLIASAEEENAGANGIRSVLPCLDFVIDLAIIGEPTEMQMAVAEKGLLVIDAVAKGEAGHAARPNGRNAIDLAMNDIQWLNRFEFQKTSETLGKVIKSVTQINAGYQHNVIPDECRFVVDVRVSDVYSLEEVFEELRKNCRSRLSARSFNNRPSHINTGHPVVQKGLAMGLKYFGSATLSDQVHFDCDSLKIGPGDSTRSHQADEFIYRSEIEEGIHTYIKLLEDLNI